MVITIVVADKAVYKDGFCYSDLALLNIPNDVRALQFNSTNNLGHIEFAYSYGDTPIPNQEISELPAWANDCLAAWDAADYAHKNPPPPTPEQHAIPVTIPSPSPIPAFGPLGLNPNWVAAGSGISPGR